VSLASLLFGAHIASNLAPRVAALPPPGRVVRHGLTVLSVLMFAATFPAYFRLSPAFRYQATAALMFAYPGTLTRYVLSLQLNPLKSPIPLGTFTANALGTALLGAFHALQRTNSPVSVTACALLQGLSDGYCGCLTTVSTFAAEIHAMKDRKAWLYVAVSWGAGQVLLLLILRPAYWTGHVREQLACSLD
jgi:CrcB protein